VEHPVELCSNDSPLGVSTRGKVKGMHGEKYRVIKYDSPSFIIILQSKVTNVIKISYSGCCELGPVGHL